jgi:hypothetical protein
MDIDKAREEWLLSNEAAVNEAQTYLTKKGNFNPPLEKPWPKYEELRSIADKKWYIYYDILKKLNS